MGQHRNPNRRQGELTRTRKRGTRSRIASGGHDEGRTPGDEEAPIHDPAQKIDLPFEIEADAAAPADAAPSPRSGRRSAAAAELTAEELLLNAGNEAASHGESGRAASIYRELLEINPAHSDARAALALVLHAGGNGEEALAELEEGIRRQPDDVPARVARGAILGAMGRFAEAEVDLKRTLELDPTNPDAYFNLGALKSRKGLWADALPYLRRSIELDPGRAAAYLHLGDALNHVDDLEGALQAYHRSAELGPSNAKAFYGLGVVYDRLNQPEEAAHMYRRSREMAGT